MAFDGTGWKYWGLDGSERNPKLRRYWDWWSHQYLVTGSFSNLFVQFLMSQVGSQGVSN